MSNTDRHRTVGAELFERLYDRDVNRLYRVSPAGDWWAMEVAANRGRLVAPELRHEIVRHERTICLSHDVEAGLGHIGIDDDLVRVAERSWRSNLARMLETEQSAGVKGTYNVLGLLLPEVRDEIEAVGHSLGFHSYDHRIPDQAREPRRLRELIRAPRHPRRSRPHSPGVDQLYECRKVDYRIKGYRPPRSRITPDLTDGRLLWHNFEWLASSPRSLQVDAPVLRDGLVRIPITLDDHPLYQGRDDFGTWKTNLLALIASHDVAVFSLHDCYAHLWLDRYPDLLHHLSTFGVWRTLDDVAAEFTLAAGS